MYMATLENKKKKKPSKQVFQKLSTTQFPNSIYTYYIIGNIIQLLLDHVAGYTVRVIATILTTCPHSNTIYKGKIIGISLLIVFIV